MRHEIVNYEWILIALFIGAAIGVPLAYLMPMTAVPQLTALSHAFGALAAALVGTAEYYRYASAGAESGSLHSERAGHRNPARLSHARPA